MYWINYFFARQLYETANLTMKENFTVFPILAFQKADTSIPGFVFYFFFRMEFDLKTFSFLILSSSQDLDNVHVYE